MRYRIDVQDTGIGIATDKLGSVFEPFVQAEASTTRRFGGTGLGLTISRGFARAMGGDIDVSSTLGQGTTFSLWLDAGTLQGQPLLAPDALAANSRRAEPVRATHWRFPPKRVLVVDDGAENRQLVRVLLEEVGLQVHDADNGQVAVDRLSAEPFDLVLMDLQMPVMDGQTATRLLRQRGCQLPIIALTANAMKGFEQQLQDAGFSGYQTKPIDVDALLHDLAQRLGGVAVAAPPELAAPDRPVSAATATNAAASAATTPHGTTSGTSTTSAQTPLVSRLASHPRLASIAARFAQQLPAKLDEMASSLAQADHAQLAALAHWLKGAGGSMGYDALFEPAKVLEAALRRGGTAVERREFEGRGLQGHAEINRQLGNPAYAATPVVDAWLKSVFGR
jgi:CheY-like chemotaxis protein